VRRGGAHEAQVRSLRQAVHADAEPKTDRLADRFEQAPPSKTSRDYTRAWRARERAGRCLLRLEVDEAALVVGLVDRGLLDPLKADDRIALTEAAGKALVMFCEGEASQREARIYDTVRGSSVRSAGSSDFCAGAGAADFSLKVGGVFFWRLRCRTAATSCMGCIRFRLSSAAAA
jgi:hypothetical protein